MKSIVIYVHGKGGSAAEAEHYRPLFPESEVIGFDYCSQTPWEAREEFPRFFAGQRRRCDRLTLIANSIGAFFSLSSLDEALVDSAYFISPVVNMERLILDMLCWANADERELAERQEIQTDFGETLSWRYLCDVREHPVVWRVPTRILYGGRDHLTSMETISAFAERTGAELTVMPDGEHWFHTEQQLRFLDDWIAKARHAERQTQASHAAALPESERLFLRELTQADFDALYAVLADSDIMQHYPYTFDEARVRGWVTKNIERYRVFGFGLWAVCLKATGEVVGDCGLTMQHINGAILPEIGYHIAKAHQRQGYAAEAARAVRDWTFAHTPFGMVYSYMKKENIPSAAVARANGMRLLDEFTDGEGGQTVVYGISRAEWGRQGDAKAGAE